MSMNQEAFDDIGQVNMQYCWSMFNAVRVECEYWVVLVWFDFVYDFRDDCSGDLIDISH